jgi:hypothetical protein
MQRNRGDCRLQYEGNEEAARYWLQCNGKREGCMQCHVRFRYNSLVVTFEILKNLGNFEIKNSKKTKVYFKIFGQN